MKLCALCQIFPLQLNTGRKLDAAKSVSHQNIILSNNNMITYHVIVSGHFSRNDNFIGIDYKGEVIHIYKIQMELLNLKSINDITFPLFAIGVVKRFDRLEGEVGDINRKLITDKNGDNEKFNRLTARAVFKNLETLIDAYANESALNLDFNPDVVAQNAMEAHNAFQEYYNFRIFSHLHGNTNEV